MKMKANDATPRYLTTREACDRLGYSRPDSFLRAWRAAGLPVWERPLGRKLVSWSDFANFIGPEAAVDHAG
jgi:hypothetical protein